jgi:hypothetical protein
MEAVIGKYRARMKVTGLALIHPVGFCFDPTLDEAVELMEFIDDCRDTIAAAQRDTEPSIESVVVDEESSSDTDGDKFYEDITYYTDV